MTRQRAIFRFISILIVITFFYSNLIYASGWPSTASPDQLNNKLSAGTQIFSASIVAGQLVTPLEFHDRIVNLSIGGQAELVLQEKRIKNDIIRKFRAKAAADGIPAEKVARYVRQILGSYPLFGSDAKKKNRVIYLFNLEENTFFRVIDKDEEVEDLFLEGLIDTSARIEVIEGVNGVNLEVYRLTEKMLSAINLCLDKLYGVQIPAEIIEQSDEKGSGPQAGTKGEHVSEEYLKPRIEELYKGDKVKDLTDSTDAEKLVSMTATYLQRSDMDNVPGSRTSLSDTLKSADRIKVVDNDEFFVYLVCQRRMRYTLLASVDGIIYLPRALVDLFSDRDRLRGELEEYLGESLFNKLVGERSSQELAAWMKQCFMGGLAHEAYEVNKWTQNPFGHDAETVHREANELEKKVAGESQFGTESAFDDICKFLILKRLGMKPDIRIFDILRDRMIMDEGAVKIGVEYEMYQLLNINRAGVSEKLNGLLNSSHKQGDEYYMLTYRGKAFAFRKVTHDGEEIIVPLHREGAEIDHRLVTKVIADYIDLKEGKERPWVVEYSHPMAEDIGLGGTKCAKLAWAFNRQIPNPPGFNISQYGHLGYLQHNPQLLEALQGIRELDVMDVKQRKRFSERVKNLMMKETELPSFLLDNIKHLIEKYSRDLGYDVANGKYASFAYRGSGLMEDFEGKIPWFRKSIGAQPGQGTTILNKKGIDVSKEAVIEALAGLFNDQLFIYRDIQVFFDFVSKMTTEKGGEGEAEYRKFIAAVRDVGFEDVAQALETENSPGYIKLRKALDAVEAQKPDLKNYHWLEKLDASAGEILDPMNLLTGVAILEQLDVYVSGTSFTSNLAKMRDGSTLARRQGKFPERDGDSFRGYTRYVRHNMGPGTGPGIVEGKFEPNISTYFLPDPDGRTADDRRWACEDFIVGPKQMRMVYMEHAYKAIEDKFSEEEIDEIVAAYGVFRSSPDEGGRNAKRNRAMDDLTKLLGIDLDDLGDWIKAMHDIWYYYEKPEHHKCSPERKEALLAKAGLSEDQFFIIAHIIKHKHRIDTDYDTMTYLPNLPHIRKSRLLPDEAIETLNDMIAEIGNLNAQERCAEGRSDWIDRRDIEWAFAICTPNDPTPDKYKFCIPPGEGFDPVTGKPNEEEIWIKLCHLQNRPINPEKEAENPDDLILEKKKVDEEYIKIHKIKPLATDGLDGFSAAEGIAYIINPYKDLAGQEEEIRKMVAEGQKVIPVLEEMGPEHDVIVAAAGAAIVWRGNDTSHAYIFSLEQRIPICIGAKMAPGIPRIEHKQPVVIDGENGTIWPEGVPLLDDDLAIRVDLLPSGSRAGAIASDAGSSEETSKLGWQSVLTRLEFLINQKVKVYPQTALAYDNLMRIRAGKIRREQLTKEEQRDVEILEKEPEVIAAVEEAIAGFPTACIFVAEKMRYIANLFGGVFPLGNKMRDYDNKEKEALMYGLIGASLYLKYDDKDPRYDSPLTGMRGSAMMSNDHLEKCFRDLRRGLLKSMKDGYRHNSFFFVFLRTPWELRKQLEDLERLCEEEGVFPEELGVMIEVPGNVWVIDDIIDELVAFQQKNSDVKEVFISFGTNDLTKLTGKISREDKDFTENVKVMDPHLLTKAGGRIELDEGEVYGPTEANKPWILTNGDEVAPVIGRSIEHVSAVAKRRKIKRSLCGQYFHKLYAKARKESDPLRRRQLTAKGRRVMSSLDSFGTQTTNVVVTEMMDYDEKTARKKVNEEQRAKAKKIGVLADIEEEGTLTGQVVFINDNNDVKKIREGEIKDKIVILTGTLGNIENFEESLIPWDYLRYARAILVSKDLDDLGEIFTQDPVINDRVKARIVSVDRIEDNAMVTVDYRNGCVYSDVLGLEEVPVELQEIEYERGRTVKTKQMVEHNAAAVFHGEDAAVAIHPLAFTLYADGKLTNGEFKKEIEELLGKMHERDAAEFRKEVLGGKSIDENITDIKNAVEAALDGSFVDNYLEELFFAQINTKAQHAGDRLAVHTTFSLTRNRLRTLLGGELIEMTKGEEGMHFDDPGYRLQGGARNISDFWQVHRAELRAFKRAQKKHDNLRLQLTTMGTRSREILELQLKVLAKMGIDREKVDLGLKLVTPADIHYVADYIKQGIKFFTYDRYELAEGLLAANFKHPDLFPGDELERAVNYITQNPLEYIRYIISENGDSSIWLGQLPVQERIPTRLLPPDLHEATKHDLIMAVVAANDEDAEALLEQAAYPGEEEVKNEAIAVIATTLNAEMGWGIDTDTSAGREAAANRLTAILQILRDTDELLSGRLIEFFDLKDKLIAYLSKDQDDWSPEFKAILGEGNGEDRLIKVLTAFLNDYPVYQHRIQNEYDLQDEITQIAVLKEMIKHQLVADLCSVDAKTPIPLTLNGENFPQAFAELIVESRETLEEKDALTRIRSFKGELNLDINCPDGESTAGQARGNSQKLVVGVFEGKRDLYRARLMYREENLIFLRGNALGLPFPDDTFSRLTWHNAAHSTAEPMIRIAKPGASFSIHTRNYIVASSLAGNLQAHSHVSLSPDEAGWNFRSSSVEKSVIGTVKKGISHPLFKDVRDAGQVDIWEAGIRDGQLVNPQILDKALSDRVDVALLNKALSKIQERHKGRGIFSGVDVIRVVDNIKEGAVDGKVPYTMIMEEDGRRVLLLDVDSFDGITIKKEGEDKDLVLSPLDSLVLFLDHEFTEGIMTLIPYESEAIRELTSNLMTVKLALETGITDIGDLSNLHPDFRFLEIIRYIHEREITEDKDRIALLVDYMSTTPYYRDLFASFNFASGWKDRIAAKIEEAGDRFSAAISVFSEITEAEEIVAQVRETETKARDKIGEFNNLIANVKELVLGRLVVSKRKSLLESLQALDGRYIRLDIDALAGNKMLMEWIKRVTEDLTHNPFIFYSSGGMDVTGFMSKNGLVGSQDGNVVQTSDNTITLLAPTAATDDLYESTLYLQSPYTITAVYLAAEVIKAGGVISNIHDDLVLETLRSLSAALFGKELTDEALEDLFRNPQPITLMTKNLNAIMTAMVQIEMAA